MIPENERPREAPQEGPESVASAPGAGIHSSEGKVSVALAPGAGKPPKAWGWPGWPERARFHPCLIEEWMQKPQLPLGQLELRKSPTVKFTPNDLRRWRRILELANELKPWIEQEEQRLRH